MSIIGNITLQKKIAFGLLLIVLLPVGLLGWFGVRMAHNEQKVIEHQLQTLSMAQLENIGDAIQAHFQAEQKRFLESATQPATDTEGLRAYLRSSPQVRHALVIGADGKRVFPPMEEILPDSERQFVERTAAIWENPAILSHSSAVGALPAQPARKFSSVSPDAEQNRYGWYAWHWNAQLHHIFWWRDSADRLIGMELLPVRMMADIVSLLPATGSDDDKAASASIRLINANGQIVYQWGRYQPDQNEQKLSMLPLSHPLGSWRLESYGPAFKAGAAINWFGMVLGIFVIALASGGLATYLYREHTREMRVAEQRVNFVNQVSHELKTPLTNIRMYAELLEDELADEDDKQRKYLSVITGESQRLSRLIGNVLRFASADKGRLALHLQPGRVDDVVVRCIEAFMPALKAKAIEVRLTCNASARVLLDAEVLEQILNNLISNVEKYAASGAMMEVSSVQQGSITTITVRDFGPGIARREQDRIFQPFYRISSRLTDGVAGTGIGLGIARELVRLHGGDLTLEASENPVEDPTKEGAGRGACFKVSLLTEPAGE
ncbi:MAG: hypothetical protein A3I66_20680 [Burkholderiales bacterium RIFCSPLOWO2_02_FULL_57_36]|nr:MAG: hypothetical protein A3I66_20680 [Burkholderiales bacterium RIFCSPLOWO2_02_FULL_57_36]